MNKNKSLIDIVRRILKGKEAEVSSPAPDEKVVDQLIERAAETIEGEGEEQKDVESENSSSSSAASDSKDNEKKKEGSEKKESCPYAMRRNIVESLREIRKFAEENDLAASMIKTLLTLLAEMALSALKGKVNGTILALLLHAVNYERDKAAAYRKGELAGRNAKIEEKYFPKEDDGLPRFRGLENETDKGSDIFSVAKEAN